MAEGFWNGLPTQVRKVWGTVSKWREGDPPQAWWRDLEGQRVAAVEVVLDGVNYGGGKSYLWDDDGSGWFKVTEGHGSPRCGHRNVPIHDITLRVDGKPDPRAGASPSGSSSSGGDDAS